MCISCIWFIVVTLSHIKQGFIMALILPGGLYMKRPNQLSIITNVYEHMFILSSCSVLNLNQLSIITNVYEHMFILSSCSVLNRLDVLKVVSEKSLKIPTEQSVIGKRTIKKRQTMIYITLHISNNGGYLMMGNLIPFGIPK